MKNKNKQKFLRFLKDNNCYHKYFKYFNNIVVGHKFRDTNIYHLDIENFFQETRVCDFLCDAFAWGHVDEGYWFWVDIERKWHKLLKNGK